MTSSLILALLFAQQVAAPEKCSISGTVIDSVTGRPLSKVVIVAEHLGTSEPHASTTTDAAGKFLMVDLDTGQYRVSAQRGGYQKIFYGARRPTSIGSSVALAEGQKLEGLQFQLMPYGVITGTVRDTDGEIVVGARVLIYSSVYTRRGRQIDQRSQTWTNDVGQYRVSDLESGKYYLEAGMSPTPQDPTIDHSVKQKEPTATALKTWYSGVLDPAAASPVDVTPGVGVTTADITIIRGRAYQVTVHLDTPRGSRSGVSLNYSTPGFDVVGNSGHAKADSNGDFSITDVPPGTYNLGFFAWKIRPYEGVIDESQGGSCEEERMPLTVGQTDIAVRVSPNGLCPTVAGHLRIEGEHPPKLSELVVNNARVRSDGSFTLDLSPGINRIELLGTPLDRDVFIKSITAGTEDILHRGMTVSGSANADLEVVLATDGGQVNGIVRDADSKPVPGATIVILPNDPTLRGSFNFTKDVITDLSGHFEIKAIAPGDYKLFAWQDAAQYSWFDPDFLKDYEARGQAVSVKAKDPAAATNPGQTVDLRVLQ